MNGVVSISCLGSLGRLGNQFFQYSVARKYAEIARCIFQTPSWIGETLFNIAGTRINSNLHRLPSDELPWGRPNVDLLGYFQFQEAVSKLKRSELRNWFNFKDEFKNRFPKKRPYYIAAHVRRGDYVTQYASKYCTITEESYLNACDKFGLDKSQLIWVREDNPQKDEEMERRGLGFLPDFMTLLNADVILRANSTFSWWAGTLGNGKVYSPLVEARTGTHTVDFVAENWPRMVDSSNVGGKVSDLHLAE